MNEQAKMQRLLKLLILLAGNRWYARAEIMERFEVSESTVYRYLDTFDNAGFRVERNNGTYRLSPKDRNVNKLAGLLHFTDEEALLLYQTLSSLEGETPLKERLAKKLHALYDFQLLAKLKLKSQQQLVSLLGEALRNKKQAELVNYRSNNSATIQNRVVEHFQFMDDYAGVWCYELQSRTCKQFKLARIQNLEVLNVDWKHSDLHILPFTDAFRMSAAKPIAHVQARLTMTAHNLLCEEYPLAAVHLQADGNAYWLNIPVARFEGIARFVLGLPGEVAVEGPAEFLEFLKNKIAHFHKLTVA